MKHYIFNATIKRTVQAERGFFLSLCFSLISGPFKKAFYSTIHLLLIEAASANKSFNSHNHHLSLQLAPIYSALFTLFCVVTLRCVDYLIFMCAWVKRKTATLCSEARQNVARRDNTNTNDGGQWEQQIGRKCSCELAWNAIDREQWLLVSQRVLRTTWCPSAETSSTWLLRRSISTFGFQTHWFLYSETFNEFWLN